MSQFFSKMSNLKPTQPNATHPTQHVFELFENQSNTQVLEQRQMGVGDSIVFLLHWNSRGQPQCSLESLRLHSKASLNGGEEVGSSLDVPQKPNVGTRKSGNPYVC